jgi:hypothetical protein
MTSLPMLPARVLSSMLTQRRSPQVSVSCEATDRACFKYLHGCAIQSTDSGLCAYTLYKMILDAELTEPAIIVGLRTSESPFLRHQVPRQRLPDQQCASSATSGNSVEECAHASERALVHCPCPLLLYIIMCNRNRNSVSYSHSSSIIY